MEEKGATVWSTRTDPKTGGSYVICVRCAPEVSLTRTTVTPLRRVSLSQCWLRFSAARQRLMQAADMSRTPKSYSKSSHVAGILKLRGSLVHV